LDFRSYVSKNKFTLTEAEFNKKIDTLTGAGIATIAFAIVAKKLLAKKTFQLVATGVIKLLMKEGVTIAGPVVLATAACAAGGPLALGCGAIAGVLTWVAGDKVIIMIDKELHQDEFNADILKSINEQKDEVKSKMKLAYSTLIDNELSINAGQYYKLMDQIKDQANKKQTVINTTL
jgi:hypothetical protein